MIAINRYHEMRYRAQTIFLKQCRIQNKVQFVHVKQGHVYVHLRDDFLSRYVLLDRIKTHLEEIVHTTGSKIFSDLFKNCLFSNLEPKLNRNFFVHVVLCNTLHNIC